LQSIDAEIQAQQRRLAAIDTFYAQKLTLSTNDANAQRELIQQQIADTADANNKILVLEEKRHTQSIANASAIGQANLRMYQSDLAAYAATANAEVAILQGSFADTEQIRAARLTAIDASLQRELSAVGITEAQKTAIYRQAEAERINVARQFPSFWQKQLQDLQASNVFSLGQITSSFSNAIAQMIVTGQGLAQFWKSLQVTMLQAVVNTSIQMATQWLLRTTTATAQDLLRLESFTGTEGAMTAEAAAGATARLGISAATNKALLAGVTVTLAAIGAVGTAALSVLGIVLEAIVGFMMAAAAAVATVPVVGQVLAGEIIVGATLAQIGGTAAILIAQGALQAALGAAVVSSTAALMSPFASGGIVTGPTSAMIGEAGSAEAVIPLNSQGASFMTDMLGLGGGQHAGPTTIIVELDGKPIMKHVANFLPSMLRLKGLPA
jgi:hypothetical protein